MHVYRISLTKFADDVTGTGSFLYGGRWNKPGTRCLYTSDSRPLAVLEYIVNAGQAGLGGQFSIVTFDIPDDNLLKVSAKDLPATWNSQPLAEETQAFGTNLLKDAKNLVIRVPSVIMPDDFNYLINPQHPGIKKVSISEIKKFVFDGRIKR